MNNFFLNNDPLLQGNQQSPMINYFDPTTFKAPVYRDWVYDLDAAVKELDESALKQLNENKEFIRLNTLFQSAVQEELMNVIKNKLNTHPEIIDNIKQQLTIIKNVDSQSKEQVKKSMGELNDYMNNYSHLTFDEYKRIKNGEPGIEMENNKKKR